MFKPVSTRRNYFGHRRQPYQTRPTPPPSPAPVSVGRPVASRHPLPACQEGEGCDRPVVVVCAEITACAYHLMVRGEGV